MGSGWRTCARATTTGGAARTAADETTPAGSGSRDATAGAGCVAQPAQHGPQHPQHPFGIPECAGGRCRPAHDGAGLVPWGDAPAPIAIAA